MTLLHHLPGSTCEALDINEVAVTLANRNAASILGDNEAMKDTNAPSQASKITPPHQYLQEEEEEDSMSL